MLRKTWLIVWLWMEYNRIFMGWVGVDVGNVSLWVSFILRISAWLFCLVCASGKILTFPPFNPTFNDWRPFSCQIFWAASCSPSRSQSALPGSFIVARAAALLKSRWQQILIELPCWLYCASEWWHYMPALTKLYNHNYSDEGDRDGEGGGVKITW